MSPPQPEVSTSHGGTVVDFTAWGCENRLVVSDPAAIGPALAWLRELMEQVDRRAGTHQKNTLLDAAAEQGRVEASDQLSVRLVTAAGWAEDFTDGRVTPFVGAASLAALGLGSVPSPGQIVAEEDGSVRWPAGRRLDLGASAKATTADLAARHIGATWGVSALVSLGGDIATAGPRRWGIQVQDLPADPLARIDLNPGWAIATSSTQKRLWSGAQQGSTPTRPGASSHILDPATLRPVQAHWLTVSVVAPTALEANAIATEALVAGPGAMALLRAHGRAARLVGLERQVLHVGGWPAEAEARTITETQPGSPAQQHSSRTLR